MKSILIFLFSTTVAFASSFYVDQVAGSDANSGKSPSAAWRTLQRLATVQFVPGDYILLRRGQVWHEPLSIVSQGSADAPLTFASYGAGQNAIIDGTGLPANVQPLVAIEYMNYVTLESLEIRNSSGDGISASGALGLIVRNCTIHDNRHVGIHVWDSNNVLIDTSEVFNNSLDTTSNYAGIRIDTNGSNSGITISRSSIHDNIGGSDNFNNPGNGITFGHTGNPIPTLTNVLVSGNEVYNNGNPAQDQAGRGVTGTFDGNITLINNDIHDNASAGVYLGDAGITVDITITDNVFRNNHLRQFGGITNGTGLAQGNLAYCDDTLWIACVGAQVGGAGRWNLRKNVFFGMQKTTYTAFIIINDSVQDHLLQSDQNVFMSTGLNQWKTSNGQSLNFSSWKAAGFDQQSLNPR